MEHSQQQLVSHCEIWQENTTSDHRGYHTMWYSIWLWSSIQVSCESQLWPNGIRMRGEDIWKWARLVAASAMDPNVATAFFDAASLSSSDLSMNTWWASVTVFLWVFWGPHNCFPFRSSPLQINVPKYRSNETQRTEFTVVRGNQ